MRLGLAVALLWRLTTFAHHSITVVYDQASPMMLDAIVTEFRFVNPHPFLILETDRNGRTEMWKLELDNRSELVAAGMTAATLKPGDRLTVKGSPARDGSHALYAVRFDRAADGFWYEQVGSSPRIRR